MINVCGIKKVVDVDNLNIFNEVIEIISNKMKMIAKNCTIRENYLHFQRIGRR